MSEIEGKVVAITGASSGIGEATALLLAERGATVVLGARRTDRLEQLAERIREAGGTASHVPVDVTKRADLETFVAHAVAEHGRLDVLVGNAGIGPISRLDALAVDDWEAMIDVNLKGFLYGVAAALPRFQAQASGHFVNIVSTAGLKIVPTMAVYAGTKNAVRTIAEALRQESGPDLRVTSISPGFVGTEFADSITDPAIRTAIAERGSEIALPAAAIARAVAFAIEQPRDVQMSEIVVNPTAQD
ncbi:MAG: SDR family oxidoreductase [Solirubrobacteraceae bacterium]|nr:SDR family oxidoreductase [Solirubrobacteraceae bacterium]